MICKSIFLKTLLSTILLLVVVSCKEPINKSNFSSSTSPESVNKLQNMETLANGYFVDGISSFEHEGNKFILIRERSGGGVTVSLTCITCCNNKK